MTEYREIGRALHAQMLPQFVGRTVDERAFGHELGNLSLDHVFGPHWSRDQLDLRSRSLVTLGILITLRAAGELAVHFPIAIRNGLTIDELEEVVYHSAGYAGYPAATHARGVAREAFAASPDIADRVAIADRPESPIEDSAALSAAGQRLHEQMMPQFVGRVVDQDAFGWELGGFSVDHLFGPIWTRPGLDLRSRSLLTLGILITLRAESELKLHFAIGLRNGLTKTELAEVVYHASSYAGFPASAHARAIAVEVFAASTDGEAE